MHGFTLGNEARMMHNLEYGGDYVMASLLTPDEARLVEIYSNQILFTTIVLGAELRWYQEEMLGSPAQHTRFSGVVAASVRQQYLLSTHCIIAMLRKTAGA